MVKGHWQDVRIKKQVRLEKRTKLTFNSYGILNQVWGFEFDKQQINELLDLDDPKSIIPIN